MLMPAVVLIVIVLGAIAVDHSLLLMTRRQLQQRVDAVADDAAGVYSQRANIEDGAIRVDCEAATAFIDQSLGTRRLLGSTAPPELTVTCSRDGRGVEVAASIRVRPVLGRAIRGSAGTVTIAVRGTGRLVLT